LPIRNAAGRFNRVQQAIANDLAAMAPDCATASAEPKVGDDDPDKLFDSMRTYTAQIDRFKQHQGKRTERKQRERVKPATSSFE
jgi:hypothetical protein